MPEMLDFDQLWDYDHPDQTERRFRDLLAKPDENGPAYRLQLLTQLARTQSLQRKFDEAHRILDDVEKHRDAQSPIVHIRYLLERGRTFNSARQPERARPLFLQAFEEAQAQHADFYAVDAAHMVAIVESGDEPLAWNLRALDLAEHSDQPRARKWRGSLYNNIGWTYHDAGHYDQALDAFEKAVACRQEYGQAAEIRIARWCVARTLRSLNRINQALAIFRELEAGPHSGYVEEELAECLMVQGKPGEAAPYFAKAYESLSKDAWLAANEPQRLARLQSLGRATNT